MNCSPQQLGFLRESEGTLAIQTRELAEDYELSAKPFARGKYATVRRCRHRPSGRELAAKCIRKRRRGDVRHEIVHEALILSSAVKCPRIVTLADVYETATEILLLMEMIPGGELQRVIDDEEHIPEPEAARLMKQILEAVVHLHDKNIAHLDLKPQNILLTGPFPGCNLKLCDFGISRLIEEGVEIREINGTPDYVAPEVLQYEPISLATDIWSVGVLAYVLLSGHTPFGGDCKQETFCNITEGHLDFPAYLFGHVSQEAMDFVKRLLKMDPRERPTARECLQHPWLRDESEGHQANGDVSLLLSTTAEEGQKQDQVETSQSPQGEEGLRPPQDTTGISGNAQADHRLAEEGSGAAVKSRLTIMSDVETMVSELKEGLALTKRLMFTDEIRQVDERMGVVY